MRSQAVVVGACVMIGAVGASGQPPPRPNFVAMVSAECYGYVARAFPISRLRMLPPNVFSGLGMHYFDCYREHGGAGVVISFVRY